MRDYSLKTKITSSLPCFPDLAWERKAASLLLFFLLISTPAFSADAVKCGTSFHLQKYGRTIARRPELPFERISESGRFKVHYALEGDDAASLEFVDNALAILDAQWQLEVDSLGFNAPPAEYDGFIHFYFEDLSNFYGKTVPDSYTGAHLTSYIVVDNDFAEEIYPTHGLDALKVTIAHEFHHVVQFGYYLNFAQIPFYEWCAVWMEEVAYDDINDYINYLDEFFRHPDYALTLQNGIHEYAVGIFIMYIDKEYGRDVMVRTWDRIGRRLGSERPFDSLLLTLQQDAVLREEIAAKWLTWCLFTGEHAVPGFGFPDAVYYDTLKTLAPLKHGGEQITQALGEFGFFARRVPGGIKGSIGSEVSADGPALGVASVNANGSIVYRMTDEDGFLYGVPGFVSAISLSQSAQEVTLSAYPDAGELPPATFMPAQISLSDPYPNPSNSIVNWRIEVDRPGWVQLDIYDVLGRLVRHEARFVRSSSGLIYTWDGRSPYGSLAASGMYFLRVKAKDISTGKSIVILR